MLKNLIKFRINLKCTKHIVFQKLFEMSKRSSDKYEINIYDHINLYILLTHTKMK